MQPQRKNELIMSEKAKNLWLTNSYVRYSCISFIIIVTGAIIATVGIVVLMKPTAGPCTGRFQNETKAKEDEHICNTIIIDATPKALEDIHLKVIPINRGWTISETGDIVHNSDGTYSLSY